MGVQGPLRVLVILPCLLASTCPRQPSSIPCPPPSCPGLSSGFPSFPFSSPFHIA